MGDLGEEEIVACACDDGDVLAYHTRAVFHALERRSASDGFGDKYGDNIRPFFNENVGWSGWGIAIHKASRMIAVSANTHEITVFAFALSSNDLKSNPNSSVDHVAWRSASKSVSRNSPLARRPSPTKRDQNLRILLEGHWNNIPNISFCNTDDDPEGCWLVSTDIDGEMLVWDIWSYTVLRRHSFSAPPVSTQSLAMFLHRVG